jgi:uncharacterized protein
MTEKLMRFVLIGAATLLFGLFVAAWDWQDRWHTEGREVHYFVKLWLYWMLWTLPVWIAAFVIELRRAIFYRHLSRGVACCVGLVVACLAAWAGLIEPHRVTVREQRIEIKSIQQSAKPLKIAVVSDFHWGLFVRDHQLQRVISELMAIKPDAVLIAGDFTYEPKRDLVGGFAGLKTLPMPVFAVLGNHDVEKPGPKLQAELRAALQANNVQMVEGRSVQWNGWRIVGLDDLWGGRPKEQIAQLFGNGSQKQSPTLVLTHQPDTIALLPAGGIDFAVAGHTHGGQIVVPILTPRVLRGTMRTTWYDGLYDAPAGKLLVTTGTGMIGLPFRFRMPPRIDVVTLFPS